MKTRLFLKSLFLLLFVLTGCRKEEESIDPAEAQINLKAASVNILNYDNFMDHMDFSFTDTPACPPAVGDWTRCGYSDNGRWARLSWNWSACPLDPWLVSTANSNLKIEVPGVWKGGQIESLRNDYGYGCYRARIKAGTHSGTSSEGTCNAFFFYNSAPTQEIDVEILNRETKQVHFVTHPGDYQIIASLPDDPSSVYIEYGFDWYRNRIDFYVNGNKVSPSQTRSVPSVRGTIMLNHWTGNPGWSGTYPPDPSVMYVDYVWHVPFLLVTCPDQSGIIWTRGNTYSITWEKYGDVAASQVSVEIWKSGKLYKTIASRMANTGSYNFKVPAGYPVSNNYRIKVKSVLSGDYYDFSNNEFRIE